MVQKEVAQRICAAPGTAAYSAFSIYVQYHAKAEILFDVPADCFVPQTQGGFGGAQARAARQAGG